MIANTDLYVSPGKFALTAIYVLSYGSPVSTHGDLSKQMLGVEAITEGVTDTFFNERVEDIAVCIDAWFRVGRYRDEVRRACYRVVDERSNPEVQCSILRGALDCLS